MKIIATLAIAALTASAAPDWRKASAEGFAEVQASASLVLNYEGSDRRKLSMYSDLAAEALTVSATAYGNARVEVDLAGDKVTKGQLEGLLLRAQSVYDTTAALDDMLSLGYKADAATHIGFLVSRAQANVYVLDARDRLATFLETK
jgi:hypothetical protein